MFMVVIVYMLTQSELEVTNTSQSFIFLHLPISEIVNVLPDGFYCFSFL